MSLDEQVRRDAQRRCAHEDCAAVSEPIVSRGALGWEWNQPHGWYKLRGGFMAWVCPDHAPLWQEIDAAGKKRDADRAEFTARARQEFEARLDVLTAELFPPIPTPALKPSVIR